MVIRAILGIRDPEIWRHTSETHKTHPCTNRQRMTYTSSNRSTGGTYALDEET